MSYDEWRGVGRTIATMVGSAMWLMGDWLAYGQEHYHGLEGFKRIEHESYPKIARETGLAEGSLRNAKCVATAVNLSRRRDKLTYCQAQEIVGRASPGQFDYWIDRTIKEDLTVKKLREALRRAKATHKIEPNDSGVTTGLAITDQYVRDIMAIVDTFTPAQKAEHLRNLTPVFKALAPS